MWTSNDMTLTALDAAELFARDCFPEYGRVHGFTGSAFDMVWSFSIYGIEGVFTLTQTRDNRLWISNVIPSPEFLP